MVLWRSSGEARYRDIVSDGPATDQAGWDGERYDRVADPQHRWGKAILPRLDLQGTEVVLDAGCGTGRVTEELLSRVPNGRVVALDASASMLDQARRRLRSWGPRVRFVRCDLLALDPQVLGDDHPVDAVFSTATFHWIGDHDRLFANLASVLVPGGQLVASAARRATSNGSFVPRSGRPRTSKELAFRVDGSNNSSVAAKRLHRCPGLAPSGADNVP